MAEWSTDRLNDRVAEWLCDWLTEWLTRNKWMTGRVNDWNASLPSVMSCLSTLLFGQIVELFENVCDLPVRLTVVGSRITLGLNEFFIYLKIHKSTKLNEKPNGGETIDSGNLLMSLNSHWTLNASRIRALAKHKALQEVIIGSNSAPSDFSVFTTILFTAELPVISLMVVLRQIANTRHCVVLSHVLNT